MCMSLALRLHSLRKIIEITALGSYEKMIFRSLGKVVHGGHSQACLQHIQTKLSFRLMGKKKCNQSLYVKYGYRSLV